MISQTCLILPGLIPRPSGPRAAAEVLPAVEALAVAAGTPSKATASKATASAQAPAALTAFRGSADLNMGVMPAGLTAQDHQIMNRKQNLDEHVRAALGAAHR